LESVAAPLGIRKAGWQSHIMNPGPFHDIYLSNKQTNKTN